MPKKIKLTEKQIERAKTLPKQLRLATIAIYGVLFVSWFIFKYPILYLVVGIFAALLLRIFAMFWLFKKNYPQKEANREKLPLVPKKRQKKKK